MYASFLALFIILLDTCSKVIVYLLLPHESPIALLDGLITIFVTVNTTFAGAHIVTRTSEMSNPKIYIFLISTFYVVMAVATRFIWTRRFRRSLRILAIVGIGIISIVILIVVNRLLIDAQLSDWLISWYSKIGGMAIGACDISLCRADLPRYIWTAYIASGFSNIASSFYPPFNVIDFFYFSGFLRVLGSGIMNVADIVNMVALAGIVIYAVWLLVRAIIRKARPV